MKTIITLTSLALLSISCTKEETAGTDATAEAVAATEVPAVAAAYPLDVCLVSDEKLGSMGDPVVINHEGREIKFCCDSCIPKFKEDPEKYLSKLSDKSAD